MLFRRLITWVGEQGPCGRQIRPFEPLVSHKCFKRAVCLYNVIFVSQISSMLGRPSAKVIDDISI